jgi:flagellin
MRIQHNIMSMNAYRNYSTNTSALSKNLEKLSSGYKINRAGDDAAGLAISEKMRAQISGLKQASTNVKDGISLIQTAEGALQEVQDMMNRMVTLAEESANGTYDDNVDRKALQDEYSALKTEIERIAKSANFNGKALFGSQATKSLAGMTLQIGDTAASYNKLKLVSAIGAVASINFSTIIQASWGVSSVTKAQTLLSKLKTGSTAAINKISSLRGKLGAVQNRLEHTANNLSVMTENVQDAESTIRDTDIAEEMTAYTKNNILIQSAQAMLAQANAVPQGVLQLLQ